jgi:succinate dehydrogenase / fumarate reductase cytochrome b subunit
VALKRHRAEGSRGGMWPWLGQRVTAVLVLVTIGVHLVLTHYFAIGQLSFDNIGQRLGVTAVVVNDVVLLLAVVYHALNGVRMVALDYGFSSRGARVTLSAFLWLFGLAAVIFGVWALLAWVTWPW